MALFTSTAPSPNRLRGLVLFLLVAIVLAAIALPLVAQESGAAPIRTTAAGGDSHPWWLPEDVSLHGREMDNLFYGILVITGVIFIIVEGLLVWFAWRYRARPGRKAVYIRGHKGIEITWTTATAVLLATIIIWTQRSWSEIKMSDPPPDVLKPEENRFPIEVQAQQFTWKFTLLGSGEANNKTSDIQPPEKIIHVQELRPVVFNLKSVDVLHSFFIPQLRIKQDVVPGHPDQVWFLPTKAGVYEIACAEFCGSEHWSMKGFLYVDTAEEYQKWIQGELEFLEDK